MQGLFFACGSGDMPSRYGPKYGTIPPILGSWNSPGSKLPPFGRSFSRRTQQLRQGAVAGALRGLRGRALLGAQGAEVGAGRKEVAANLAAEEVVVTGKLSYWR